MTGKAELTARLLAAVVCLLAPALPAADLPYRFLLVISDQWKDPGSYVVDDPGEFQTTVALLKSWGLPFEILRLDQQRLDRYHLLERDGSPRYGTVIWNAGPGQYESQGIALLAELVRDHGVGLVVLGDAVANARVAGLAGLEYVSEFDSPEPLSVAREHFIHRGVALGGAAFLGAGAHAPGYKVISRGADVVLRRGPHPFLTARQVGQGGRVAWLGVHREQHQIRLQAPRRLLKRALVWAQGYAVYAEYPRSVLLMMDDMGTAEKTLLPYWSYRTPTEEEIRKGLVEPLKRHNAVMMQNVNTGWVYRKTQRVLNPWKQTHVQDLLVSGRVHDYSSTKRGLDAGLREGVFEIQSQGWTHMLPDLDSPPGPWWDAPMDGVGSLGWWTEFGDPVRRREIPAITQLAHMRRSIEQIEEDFGVRPLFLMRGGGGHSRSWPNHSARLAAQAGFGLSELGGDEYLGPDLVVNLQPVLQSGGWKYDRPAPQLPDTTDAPFYLVFHDRDVAVDPGSIARLLEGLGSGVRYMSANEYCGYLHARIERAAGPPGSLSLAIRYDSHYGRYFAAHGSKWILHLTDDTRQAMRTAAPEVQTLTIPPGAGARCTVPAAGAGNCEPFDRR